MGKTQLALPPRDPTNSPTPLYPTRPAQPIPLTSLRSLRFSEPDIHHSSLLQALNTAIDVSKPNPRTPSPPHGPHRQTPATNTTNPFATRERSKTRSKTRHVRATGRFLPFPPPNLRKVEVRVPRIPMLFRTGRPAFETRSADPGLVDPFVEEGGGGRGKRGAWTPMAPLGMSFGRYAGRSAAGGPSSGRSAPGENASEKFTSRKSFFGKFAPGKSAPERSTFEATEKRPRGRTRKSAVQTAMPYPVAVIPARNTKGGKAAKGGKGVKSARITKPQKPAKMSKAAKSVAAKFGAASVMNETVAQSMDENAQVDLMEL